MNGSYKQFDPALYEQYNRAAIDAVRSHINASGLFVQDNDDIYGPDLVVYLGFKPRYYVECEVKLIWSGPDFPFDTIQLPERKAKFARLPKPCEFWICNREYTHAIVISDRNLEPDMIVEVPNKLVANGELFYQVPIDRTVLVELEKENDETT